MNLLAWTLLAATFPGDNPRVLSERVAYIELNSYHDECGRCIFCQDIFYDLTPDGRYEVRAWRLVKDESLIPQRDWQRGDYFLLWFDADGKLREVRADAMQESWTQHDPELAAREWLPSDKRKGLRK